MYPSGVTIPAPNMNDGSSVITDIFRQLQKIYADLGSIIILKKKIKISNIINQQYPITLNTFVFLGLILKLWSNITKMVKLKDHEPIWARIKTVVSLVIYRKKLVIANEKKNIENNKKSTNAVLM